MPPKHRKPAAPGAQRTFTLEEVDAVVSRWQARVQNQIAIINRLLGEDGPTYTLEIAEALEKLETIRAWVNEPGHSTGIAGDEYLLTASIKKLL